MIDRYSDNLHSELTAKDTFARRPGRSSGEQLFRGGLVLLLLAIMAADDPQAIREASRHIKTGINHFNNQEFEEADKSFVEADVSLPENPRVAFNRGCVALAKGELDAAIDLFRSSVVSAEAKTVAESHYNLGVAYSAKARGIFGEQPEQADEEIRKKGLEPLALAVRHYRNALDTDPRHASARKNLELIRLWIKHMQDVWARRDRDQRREKLGFIEFLAWIQKTQDEMRQLTRPLDLLKKSPRRHHALMELAKQQKLLREEHSFLDEKIRKAVEESQPNPDEEQKQQLEQAISSLTGLTRNAFHEMDVAIGDLERRSPVDAASAQKKAIDQLDAILRQVAPFELLLDKAKATQQFALDQNRQVQKQKAELSEANVTDPSSSGTSPPAKTPRPVDKSQLTQKQLTELLEEELSWRQEFTTGYTSLLAGRARIERETLRESNQTKSNDAPAGQEELEQRQALLATMDKAIELGDQANEESKLAGEALSKLERAKAEKHQVEVLRLLEEIDKRKKQPPQNQQQDQEDQDQKQDNGQNNDRQNEKDEDQPDKGDQKKEEQRKDNEKEQQQKEENKDKQDKQDDDQKSNEQTKKSGAGEKREDLSRRQAEAILRRVREREREHRERKRKMLAPSRVRVDKDW